MQLELMRRREGFALPAAILAMVVIGALVTGGFYAASHENRISTSSDHAADALRIAEQGLSETVGAVTRPRLQAMAPHGTLTHDGQVGTGRRAGTYAVQVRRLGDTDAYFLISTGTITRGSQVFSRQASQLVRIRRFDLVPRASLQILADIAVTGNSTISGFDEDPTGWTGCEDGEDTSGVTNLTGPFPTQGAALVEGDPAIEGDPNMTDDDFTDFGDYDYDGLAALASRVYPSSTTLTGIGPVASGGVCSTGVNLNWGAPENQSHACRDFFPIIHARGNLILSNGTGQGILLVDGDLSLTGNFRFYGITIVRGTLNTTGTGNHMSGTTLVMSGGGSVGDPSMSAGNSTLQYSSCAVNRAASMTQNFMYAAPVAYRSWIDLTSAGVGN
jgi:hypothetical protein